jgi:hypothetical protein
MKPHSTIAGCRALLLAAAVSIAGTGAASAGETGWTNIVSDIPGVARYSDANLVNPIGLQPLVPTAGGSHALTVDNATGLLSVFEAPEILGAKPGSSQRSVGKSVA